MEQKHNNGFSYTYSAKEQAEIRKIREKYAQQSEEKDTMARLRYLDAGVTKKAQAVALVLGILGTLILGSGMSLFMSDLGAMLGLDGTLAMLLGVSIGAVGCVLVGLAYPVYHLVLTRARKRIAPEILRLTDKLMK